MALDYAKVTGTLAIMVADTTGDVDENPDLVLCDSGTVTFTPTVLTVAATGESPPLLITPVPVIGQVNSTGQITLNGQPELYLLDLGSSKLNPAVDRSQGAYRVDFANLSAGGNPVTMAAFYCNPSSSVTNDLASMAELSSGSGGKAIVVGAGVPAGGATGALLAKASSTDYDDAWVDVASAISGFAVLLTGSQTVGGVKAFANLPTSSATPSSGNQLVNKDYADGLLQGQKLKDPCRLGTRAALAACTYDNGAGTLTANANGTLSVDSTAAVLADRILVKNQASALQNGIYTVSDIGSGSTPWILTRSTDMDIDAEVAGAYTIVTSGAGGSLNIGAGFTVSSTAGPYTIGTTAIAWTQTASIAGAELAANKNQASGYAGLNGAARVPLSLATTGTQIVVRKDTATGFWPASWDSNDNPVYTGGANNAGVRPSSRADLRFVWTGPEPSPGIVTSGTAGMLQGSDDRDITP